MTQGFPINFTAPLLFGIFLFANGHSTAADKLRIGYSGATVSNAMLWVTEEGKLFQKNGIDPQIFLAANDPWADGDDCRRSRHVRLFGSLLASARLQGADVVMVVSFLNKPLYRLVVRPEIKRSQISKENGSALLGSAQ